ncbi:MAG: ATPase, T2SS/T4P/T4SS family [Nitrospinota bacterium]|nr:ATPase, T2SS/T4P/T4SS family [Nitrospinota bacterium]MDH5678052.1 ATPase, T2SS/T4P/T4SS family [Nitrospinota bacterium]MDH5755783.1 ATPase, T2SS/T4P/T4SS family [Nitrospinota bacterium]
MFTATVITPKGRRSFVKLMQDPSVIGKDRNCDILLLGWKIASRHAEIRYDDSGAFINALAESDMPLLVNGQVVDRFGPLKGTDKISIGSYTIYIKEDEGFQEKEEEEEALPSKIITNRLLTKISPEPAQAPHAPQAPPRPAKKQPMISAATGLDADGRKTLFNLLAEVHGELLKQIDLRRVDVNRMSDEELRSKVHDMLTEIIGQKTLPHGVRGEYVIRDMLNEVVGLGPLEGLLADESVSEIMVNKFDEVFVERKGRLELSDTVFSSDKAVMSVIERVVAPLGRRIDESSPYVDGRLKDGSRFNAIIPPLALRGPSVTIRKFGVNKLTHKDLVSFNAISPQMAAFFEMVVLHRKNTVISGGTGSGKTTLLNVLSNFIPSNERIVTVEDAAELKLAQPHLVSLEARPANMEGKGEVTIRDLVRNCLRMRPDRIVVGECRGGEALDMLQAMNTGHDGSLTTLHANTPRDCIARLEIMVLMTGMDIPVLAIREQIASAVDIIVQQTRFSCGTRKVTYITEVTGVQSGVVSLQDLFVYQQEGYGADGKIKGHFRATGAIPEFYQDLKKRGINVDLSIFTPPAERSM